MISKELLFFLTKKEILKKYKQSVLGFFWFLLKPTIMICLLYFAYYKIGSVESNSHSGILIIITGYLPWFLISQIITQTSNSLIKNKNLVEKTDTSRNILILSSSLYSIFEFFIFYFISSITLIFFFDIKFFNILFFLLYSLLLIVFSYSISSIFAVINVWFRDMTQIIQYMINLFAFILPIGFLASNINGWSFFYSSYNPLIFFIEYGRQIILDNIYYSSNIVIFNIVFLIIFSSISFIIIQKKIKEIADII